MTILAPPAELVVDGATHHVDPITASSIDQVLRKHQDTSGNILVGFSWQETVMLLWVSSSAADAIRKLLSTPPGKKSVAKVATPRGVPWAAAELRQLFDAMAIEKQDDFRAEFDGYKLDVLSNGKRPESYRRWLHRTRREWVRTSLKGNRDDDREMV